MNEEPASTASDAKSGNDLSTDAIHLTHREREALSDFVMAPLEPAIKLWKQQFNWQADVHALAVLSQLQSQGMPHPEPRDFRTYTKYLEWREEAGHIDPENETLSSAWRAVLDDILDKNNGDEDALLLDAVKRLPRGTILYFLENFPIRPSLRDITNLIPDYRNRQLEDSGLVHRRNLRKLLIVVFCFLLFAFGLYQFTPSLFDFMYFFGGLFGLGFIGFACVTIFMLFFARYQSPVVTNTGVHFISLATKYKRKAAPNERFAVDDSPGTAAHSQRFTE